MVHVLLDSGTQDQTCISVSIVMFGYIELTAFLLHIKAVVFGGHLPSIIT
jgi:hypothetical protein